MTRKQFDMLLVVALIAAGALIYPWARVQYHLTLLQSPNAEQAIASQDALKALGRKAQPRLIEYVRESDEGAPRRMVAEVVLGLEFGQATNADDPQVVNLALELARHDWDYEVQSRAVLWLTRATPAGGETVMRELLRHPDPQIREEAMRGLLAYGQATVADLAPLLLDEDPNVVYRTAIALGQLTGEPLQLPHGDAAAEQLERERAIHAWLTQHGIAAPPAPVARRRGASAGPMAPDFELPGLDGGTVRLSDLRGKPVLLNFWATWCPPCDRELPALASVARELGDEATVLGVTLEFENTSLALKALEAEGRLPEEHDHDHEEEASDSHAHSHGFGGLDPRVVPLVQEKQREMIAAKVAEHGIAYPIAIGDEEVQQAYGVFGLPVSILVGPDGRILRRIVGDRHESYFRHLLESAVARAQSNA